MSIDLIKQKLTSLQHANSSNFNKLDQWLQYYLDMITHENTNIEKRIPNIRRGQILYVDFGYNILSEFRYKHYCVAINNSPRKNPKVTVIPITSKKHPHQLELNYELEERLEDIIINKERSNFWKPFRNIYPQLESRGFKLIAPAIGTYDTVYPNCTKFIQQAKTFLSDDDVELHSILDQILNDLHQFNIFYKSSPSLHKSSYLRVEDITTISKARIISPRYTSHPLYQLRLSDTTLDLIDTWIINKFTGSN
jgi:hypothetical protein